MHPHACIQLSNKSGENWQITFRERQSLCADEFVWLKECVCACVCVGVGAGADVIRELTRRKNEVGKLKKKVRFLQVSKSQPDKLLLPHNRTESSFRIALHETVRLSRMPLPCGRGCGGDGRWRTATEGLPMLPRATRSPEVKHWRIVASGRF